VAIINNRWRVDEEKTRNGILSMLTALERTLWLQDPSCIGAVTSDSTRASRKMRSYLQRAVDYHLPKHGIIRHH
jgi:hypothetical protein